MRTRVLTGVAAVAVALTLTASSCGNDPPDARADESDRQQNNYEGLVADQPAIGGPYSPTRDTINFWTGTWMQEPDKLAYVYLLASNGQMIGYFIFEGLPVSYCASLSPTYRWEDIPNDGGNAHTQVPAPAMDGVYYSGNQCNVLYGKDATSGSYMEYSIGNGISHLLYSQPLPRQDVEPLGFTTIEDVD